MLWKENVFACPYEGTGERVGGRPDQGNETGGARLAGLSEPEKQSSWRAWNARPHRSLEPEKKASAFGLGISSHPLTV